MAVEQGSEPERKVTRRRPATTPEGRENQLVSLAIDAAEKQLLAGTASAQVITHYLKLGSTREKLEQERLQEENKLLRAKTDSIAQNARMEDLVKDAIEAMRSYSGKDPFDHDDPND